MIRIHTLKTAAMACSAAGLLLALAGCSAFASSGGTSTIGEQADAAVQVSVTNETGKDIEGFYFKGNADKKYGAALAQDGLLEDGASATLLVPNPDEAALDMRFVTNDGAKYQIKSLDVADVQDASLKLSSAGESSYIEYTSAASGKPMSILESEQVAKAEAEAAAEAKAAAKAAKQEAKDAKKAQEDAVKQAEEDAQRAAADEARKLIENAAKNLKVNGVSVSTSSSGSSSSSSNTTSSTKSSSSSTKSSSSSSSEKSSTSSKSSSSDASKKDSGSSSSKDSSSSSSKSAAAAAAEAADAGEDNRCIDL